MKFYSYIYLGMMLTIYGIGGCGGTTGGNPEVANRGVQIYLTDAPVDNLKALYLTIAQVSVKQEQGEWIDLKLEKAEEIDVLSLQNGVSELISSLDSLTAGTYTELRLILSDKTSTRAVTSSDEEVSVTLPSGSSSGMKFKGKMTVSESSLAQFTLDLDLRKSLKQTGQGKVMLSPIGRIVENSLAASINGSAQKGDLICLYESSVAAEVECSNAVNTSKVKDTGYTLAFLEAGTYKIIVVRDEQVLHTTDTFELSAKENKTLNLP